MVGDAMKRMIRLCALMIAAVCCFSSAVHAADSYFELDGFAFDINNEGKATIHDYSGNDTDVVIPSTLLRAPVIAIGDYAFYGKEITSVSFDSATQLETIGDYAFYNCSSLSELSLPTGIGLSFGSLQNCTALETLSIEEGIDTIPEQCFYGCSSLSEITLPDSVTTIEKRAFSDCIGLRYAYLSNNVESIAENAFSGDDDLTIRCEYGSYAAQYAKDNDIPVEYLYRYLLGDADGNEHVSLLDVTVIQRYLARVIDDPDGLIALRGCVTGEMLGVLDAAMIQRHQAHMDIPYPVGEEVSGYTSCEDVFNPTD